VKDLEEEKDKLFAERKEAILSLNDSVARIRALEMDQELSTRIGKRK
jgi:hypothetical protein